MSRNICSVLLFFAASIGLAQELPKVVENWNATVDNGGADAGFDIAHDAVGNAVVTGPSHATNLGLDYLTTKYNSTGGSVFSQRFAAPAELSDDTPHAIAVDALGNSYVTGQVSGTATTIKYSASGTQLWAKAFGRDENTLLNDVVLDAGGNVYVAGYIDNYATSGPVHRDLLLLKYNSAGTLQWSRTWGSTANKDDEGLALTVIAGGDVAIGGRSGSVASFMDWMISRWGPDGTMRWTTTYAGTGNGGDEVRAIVADLAGSVYVAGPEFSSGGHLNWGVARYDVSGNETWHRQKAGVGDVDDVAEDCLLIGSSLYVVGTMESPSAGRDITLMKFDTAGTEEWRRSYGGSLNVADLGADVAGDAFGFVYVLGTLNNLHASGSDFGVRKYDSAGNTIWTKSHNNGPATNAMDVAKRMTINQGGDVFVTGYSGNPSDRETYMLAQAPEAFDDNFTIDQGQSLNVSKTQGPLKNDKYALTATVTQTQAPLHGTLTLNSDGSFVYAPIAGFNGIDTFKYRLNKPGLLSSSATVTILVRPLIQAINFLGDEVVSGGINYVVELTGPAPESGLRVNLSSNNPSVLTVDPFIDVVAGNDSHEEIATAFPVATPTTVTVTASRVGSSATDTVVVRPAKLRQIHIAPESLTGGESFNVRAILDGTPATEVVVSLVSSHPDVVSVPGSVTVPSTSTVGDATATSVPVAANVSVTVTGTQGGESKSDSVLIKAPAPELLTLNPTQVVGGSSSTGNVTLDGNAPAGGYAVALADNSGSITVPGSVSVTAGSDTASFLVETIPVNGTFTRTVSATANGTTQTASLTLVTPSLTSITLAVSEIIGGDSTTGTVTLNGAATGFVRTVNLASNSSAIIVPASVSISGGNTSATFNVATKEVTQVATRRVTATLDGVSLGVNLILKPNPGLLSLTLVPSTVVGGQNSTGTVRLGSPAPSGGAVVTITDNSGSITTPATVTVPAGLTEVSFTIGTSAVNQTFVRSVTAAYDGRTKTASLTLTR